MTKIKNVKMHGAKPVAEGKLVLIETDFDRNNYKESDLIGNLVLCRTEDEPRISFVKEIYDVPLGKAFGTLEGRMTYHGGDFVGNILKTIKPVIISESEELDNSGKEEWYYDSELKIVVGTVTGSRNPKICFKILVLPGNFSPEQLQMIIDGKLKDGDKILVECERLYFAHAKSTTNSCFYCAREWDENYLSQIKCREKENEFQIKLNEKNHITIHLPENKITDKQIGDLLDFSMQNRGKRVTIEMMNNEKEKATDSDMKILYQEMNERMKHLESQEQTEEIKTRIKELTLAIVRVQQFLLEKIGKQKL